MQADGSTASLTEHLRLIALGDRRAMRALYLDTRPKLFSMAIRFMRQREAAEDLLQEVYLTVWRKAGQFDPKKGDPGVWLYMVVRSRALDALRRQQATPAGALPEADAVVDPAPSPMAVAERESSATHMRRSVEELSPRYARALRSIYFEELSYPQFARREQIPVPTAKSLVRRALLQIRRSVEQGADALQAPLNSIAAPGPSR